MTLFVGGLVVGFAVGWGLYWYLALREGPFSRRLRLEQRPPVTPDEAVPLVSVQRVERVVLSAERVPEPAPDRSPPAVEPAPLAPPAEILAYCVRCRHKRRMHEPQLAEVGDGRMAYRGTCVVCGARMFALR
ncbi:MAG: DUF5679 domain-containing protein [Ardenticatenaceae bacterium]|nr:DUF5679 domain-containing protein [Ardenticatenaceae bacterium]HBY94023.1 hypothetical protein [Chloroflexota bacterium]